MRSTFAQRNARLAKLLHAEKMTRLHSLTCVPEFGHLSMQEKQCSITKTFGLSHATEEQKYYESQDVSQ